MFLRPRLLSVPQHGTGIALAALTFALGLAIGSTFGPIGSSRSTDRYAAPPLPAPAPVVLEPMGLRTSHPAEVLRVLDGDTFEARVHLWPGLDITTRVRLRGVDAPEMKARCADERATAEAARDALRAMLEQGEVAITRVTLDKYGVVADASSRGTPDIAAALIKGGLARRYDGGRHAAWCP
jgi:endonuclease YncB( thermonuclease family)